MKLKDRWRDIPLYINLSKPRESDKRFNLILWHTNHPLSYLFRLENMGTKERVIKNGLFIFLIFSKWKWMDSWEN